MTLKHYKTLLSEKLSKVYDEQEIEAFFYLILEAKLDWRRIDFALRPDFEIAAETLKDWEYIARQLSQEVPVQYLLGKAHFFGLELKVSPSVLIPRPETEELVEWVIDSSKSARKILDIGTGSGAIAIALAKNLPGAEVHAIDVSPEALEIAKQNAESQNARISFVLQDILKARQLPDRFDCIVSNPPYVRNLEKHEIKTNVLQHEPHLALFVDDLDPLVFYSKIGNLAFENLPAGGTLYFEINQYLGKEMQDLMAKIGFKDIVLRKDIYGNDRMIKGVK